MQSATPHPALRRLREKCRFYEEEGNLIITEAILTNQTVIQKCI